VTLRVLLFGPAREAAGGREAIDLDLPGERASAADALLALASSEGELGRVAARARLAVNRAFARPETTLAATDEVALIPPVGGG
jgi:molybdopterin converting factor small subunit